jgi:hypothetical protein
LKHVCPKAQIDFILGNHEVRLWKCLVSSAPALGSLDCLNYGALFELEKYRINHIASKSMLNPNSKNDNHKIYGGSLLVTHGSKLGRFHANEELATWNMNGISGHVHHFQTQSKRDLSGGTKTWISQGCMCVIESGKEYVEFPRWQQGFSIAHVHNGQSQIEHISIQDGFACSAGRYYYR